MHEEIAIMPYSFEHRPRGRPKLAKVANSRPALLLPIQGNADERVPSLLCNRYTLRWEQ
jgi:hypothetical protein